MNIYFFKLQKQIFCIYTLFKNRHVGISALFALSKTKKIINPARFLEVRGDEKHVIEGC